MGGATYPHRRGEQALRRPTSGVTEPTCHDGAVPPFSPFPGLRYRSGLDLADVTAPPYDVIDDAGRSLLAGRSDRNVVQLDLPEAPDGGDRYGRAAEILAGWLADGTLVRDPEPTFTIYRMTYRDDRGRPARTLGVIGALGLSRPGEGEILPHEFTTPKARTDRLDLLRATHANLSAVWVLSMTEGLTSLLERSDPPDAEWTDEDGTGHAVWRVTDPATITAVAAAVARTPVVVADGHHRYETSLVHRDERRAEAGADVDLGSDAMMALVVELDADELCVRPIHRLLDGIDTGTLDDRLTAEGFVPTGEEVAAHDIAAGTVLDRMADTGAIGVVGRGGSATLWRSPDPDSLDSERLQAALAGDVTDGVVTVRYQHGVDHVVAAVSSGAADIGVLIRPATVERIDANARSGDRMPPKTTFFHPKPRTGVVIRQC